MLALYNDMVKCRIHQTGSTPTEIVVPVVGDTVEDSNATSQKGYAQYETLSNTCQAARLNVDAGELGLQSVLQLKIFFMVR